ncbi:hypothetical protein GmarT_25850 [Gimesia maris]|uniref:Uncharacterized protein n=1 Tax=Gimesia maris TaxID=122 RepID=A0ABX5YLZ4_9PLAN|nr:hypothetical protein GmarT_25850 [Gimesia maris]
MDDGFPIDAPDRVIRCRADRLGITLLCEIQRFSCCVLEGPGDDLEARSRSGCERRTAFYLQHGGVCVDAHTEKRVILLAHESPLQSRPDLCKRV